MLIKPQAGFVSPQAATSDVLVAELPSEPLEGLEALLAEVYIPLLANPANQEGWGEVAARDVMDRLHALLAQVTIAVGATRNETVLPLPPLAAAAALSPPPSSGTGHASCVGHEHGGGYAHGAGAGSSAGIGTSAGTVGVPGCSHMLRSQACTKSRIRQLEGSVLVWTRQLKAVLRQASDSALRAGAHPGPDAELSFWRDKAATLNAIFQQLQSDRIRRVLQFLDASESNFCTVSAGALGEADGAAANGGNKQLPKTRVRSSSHAVTATPQQSSHNRPHHSVRTLPATQPFAHLCKDVFAARHEANDNVKFLRPLEPFITRLMSGSEDFDRLSAVFPGLMHTLLLIWQRSGYYNTATRLVVVVREICNAVIARAQAVLSGRQVLELIAAEQAPVAVARLKATLRVCTDLKRAYAGSKALAATAVPANPWRIQNAALFQRLDDFMTRCHDVLELAAVHAQFAKLDRLVLGGSKGAALTAAVARILHDFRAAVAALDTVQYDLLDVERDEFVADMAAFRASLHELERHLASVFAQAFDDCATLHARHKLLDSFDVMLERPLLQDELERRYPQLVQLVAVDLKRVQEIFLTERVSPPIFWNMPPMAGALAWCRGLKERLAEPMARTRALSRDIMASEEAKEVVKLYETILASLDGFERARIAEWGTDVERSSRAKLELPLLVRTSAAAAAPGACADACSGSRLRVNFDPELTRLLREAKYFLLLGLEVPSVALEIYKKAEVLRRQTGALGQLVTLYNQMMAEMLPVEAPLLRAQLVAIDVTLARGMHELCWKSVAIDAFIADAQAAVRAAHEMLFKLKSNLADIVTEMDAWSREPLLMRKAKPLTPDELETAYKSSRTLRYAAIAEGGKAIDRKLKESAVVMRIPKGGTPHWSAYVDFVNGVVLQGLSRLVTVSLRRLLEMMSLPITGGGGGVSGGSASASAGGGGGVGTSGGSASSGDSEGEQVTGSEAVVASSAAAVAAAAAPSASKCAELPFLVIDLTLSSAPPRALRFTPSVAIESNGGGSCGSAFGGGGSSLHDLVAGWVDSFYRAATVFRRLDDGEGRFAKELADDVEVQSLLAQLSESLSRSAAAASDVRGRFDSFAFLWQGDMHDAFRAFCADAYTELPRSDEQARAEAADAETGCCPPGAPQPRVPDLAKFDAALTHYRELAETAAALQCPVDVGWLRINTQPIKAALVAAAGAWAALFVAHLQQFVGRTANDMADFISGVQAGLEAEVVPAPAPSALALHAAAAATADGVDALEASRAAAEAAGAALRRCMGHTRDVRKTRYVRKALILPLRRAVALLKKHGAHVDDIRVAGGSVAEYLEQAELKLEHCINAAFAKKEAIFAQQTAEADKVRVAAAAFDDRVRAFWNAFRKSAPFAFTGTTDAAYTALDAFHGQLVSCEASARELNEAEELFELPLSKFVEIPLCHSQLRILKALWDFRALALGTYDSWRSAPWAEIDTVALEEANKSLAAGLKKLGDAHAVAKGWGVYKDTDTAVRDMATTLPLVNELHSPAMRARHWAELARVCGVRQMDPASAKFRLDDLLELRLHTHKDAVEEIIDTASKEQKIERKMTEIESVWHALTLDFVPHKDGDVRMPRASDEVMESLDTHQLELQAIVSMGRVVDFFRERVEAWQRSLGVVEEVLKEWLAVTKAWASLESIFLGSADIRAQLERDTKRFEGIDSAFKELMKAAVETPNVVQACAREGRGEALKDMSRNLELCQKSLSDYLDTKKKIFPRFYFVSNVALLDILSNSNNPPKIMKYLGDCYDSLANLEFAGAPNGGGGSGRGSGGVDDAPSAIALSGGGATQDDQVAPVSCVALKMIAKDGEVVELYEPFVMVGAVERWLNELTEMQQNSLRYILAAAIETAVNWETEKPRHLWLEDYPAQIVLVGAQIFWTEETQTALDELEAGQEDAVKKYLGVCNERLAQLIARVLSPDLSPDLRTKIISLITMDVHARDVVAKLVDSKAEGPSSFIWSQQLRCYWAADTRDVNIAITDFRAKYSYEWVGNSGRLVITPLTDRCYITLTLALRLFLGGAPAGPAGTGKTETTKDLARALALPCYVFNCSDQMTYQTLADIFKGLAQTGAWGCFDEFNRIGVEVLSVVATQVKAILDACVLLSAPAARALEYQGLPAGAPPVVVGQFELGGDTVNLIPTVGLFITMNPGYAGRTELPENLKVLFRSCAMIRPDLMLICENMLMSEGFQHARPLSVKFVTLYQLASELLSPQPHYDWGLRAVKSVLRVAGMLKRGEPAIDEEGILMRALRDFNTPKMPTADLPIFLRLIRDLFPRFYQLPTKLRADLVAAATQACKEARPLPLQHDHGFIAKVVQLQDLMDVRHSVMLVGPAGAGKTTVWKTLAAAHNLGRPKNKALCVYEVIDPKALTSNELYGYMTMSKEWRQGVLSIIMRGMSKNYKELGYSAAQTHKWVVLDGDIDAVWIESMNCFPADDHEVLTEHGFWNCGQVLRHFQRFQTLHIACFVPRNGGGGGLLEYHPITIDNVTIKDGNHSFVSFDNADGVSVTVTANHRMYARSTDKLHSDCTFATTDQAGAQAANTQFSVHKAGDLFNVCSHDPTHEVQFETLIAAGEAPSDDVLPFFDELGLTTDNEIDAFLELYGYWLAVGELRVKNQCLEFSPKTDDDDAYLNDIFMRLRKVLPRSDCSDCSKIREGVGICTGEEAETVRNTDELAAGVRQRNTYRIYQKAWWNSFYREYVYKHTHPAESTFPYSARTSEVAASGTSIGTQLPSIDAMGAALAVAVPARSIWRADSHALRGGRILPGAEVIDRPPNYGTSAVSPAASSRDTMDSSNMSVKWQWHWVWRRLGMRRLRLVIRGLRVAAGAVTRQGTMGQGETGVILTSCSSFRDDLMRLCMHAGYSVFFCVHRDAAGVAPTTPVGAEQSLQATKHGHASANGSTTWAVQFCEGGEVAQPTLRRANMSAGSGNGRVWCVTVPTRSQLIVVRRVLERDAAGTPTRASRPLIVGNTVMDDNKVLTLVSNERIPLSPAMRMVFEVNSLANASPATVSRAGILYINETDIGWRPLVESWMAGLGDDTLRAHLPGLFDKYIDAVGDGVRRTMHTIVPLPLINQVMSVCRLMDGFLEAQGLAGQAPRAAAMAGSGSIGGIGGGGSGGVEAYAAIAGGGTSGGTSGGTALGTGSRRPVVELIEALFFLSVTWAFGGALLGEESCGSSCSGGNGAAGGSGGRVNHRLAFHSLMVTTAGGGVKLPREPEDATVFDWSFNAETEEFELWAARQAAYVPAPVGRGPGEVPFSELVVPTVDSTRLGALLRQLVSAGHPAMFVGNAGTGKTTLVRSYLSSVNADKTLSAAVAMHYFMDSAALQALIDGAVDKRSGRVFGPPTGKKLVFFIDDLNLPYLETYGTQNALSLLRQVMDHRSYFDRSDLGCRKEIVDCQYLAAMNPAAGSFTVTERLQRLFTTFACLTPSDGDLQHIFRSIATGHLARGFAPDVAGYADALADAGIRLHRAVAGRFLPDAERFTYAWSMRELAAVFEGVCSARPEFMPTPQHLQRLWLHEAHRVYGDRLVDAADAAAFDFELRAVVKSSWKDSDGDALFAPPLLYTSFVGQVSAEPAYLPLHVAAAAPDAAPAAVGTEAGAPVAARGGAGSSGGMVALAKALDARLDDYNSAHPIMDLVLFEEAMEHVARIARVLGRPGGNCLLIGVGGSGKQSLAKLAAHICGYEVRQLQITARYGAQEMREELKQMYRLAGVKGLGVVFLLADAQIVSERFLVPVNDMLATGWVADLFNREELDDLLSAVRSEAKNAGVAADDAAELLKFFIAKCRANLHIALCLSPVGEALRVRARRFPALVSCAAIDKFHAWPKAALVSVAMRYLADLDLGGATAAVAAHMAEAHCAVTALSESFRAETRRHNYVTPKSFLEFIAFYRHLLAAKREASGALARRLDDGLAKLRKSADDVAELKIDVAEALARSEEEVRNTDLLVAQISRQRAEAEVEKEAAAVVAAKASSASAAAAAVEAEAEDELSAAKPALERAQAAVKGLDKSSLTELKNFNKPPKGVEKVTACCLMMLEGEFKAAENWARAKKMMADVGAFLAALERFDAKRMSEDLIARLEPYVQAEGFTEGEMRAKSSAAANLCSFVVNVFAFNRIYVKVKPLMDALDAAQKDRAEAQEQLDEAAARVARLEAALQALEATLAAAVEKKSAAEATAQRCASRLSLAGRLVTGLASENARWAVEVAGLRDAETRLVGDAALAAAFVSYAGAFDARYRRQLWAETWAADLRERGIPLSDGADPLAMLTDEASTARMLGEGLPADRVSLENGAIVTASKRWPLLVDPQLQGVKWLARREADARLTRVQLTAPGWLKAVVAAIQAGTPVLVENVGEELDATLEPVLSRAVYAKGRTLYMRVGGEEVEYDARFRLYLQTKFANPHFRPELQAQCTLVNFIATEGGLTDQLLARAVAEEKPELEERRLELQAASHRYKLQLLSLEDDLLSCLAAAPDDILSDVSLIEGLEATKAASADIAAAVARGRATEADINAARAVYVPVAEEGAMLFFLISALGSVDHMYQYSLDAFMVYFYKAMRGCTATVEDVPARVQALRQALRLAVFTWVSRGLFERHKLILLAQITFTLMSRGRLNSGSNSIGGGGGGGSGSSAASLIAFSASMAPDAAAAAAAATAAAAAATAAAADSFSSAGLQYLLRGLRKVGEAVPPSLADWLPAPVWGALLALAELEGGEFARMPADIAEAPTRFREWFNHVAPEVEKLPLDWAALDKAPFKKLLVLRAMRPDRLAGALRDLVRDALPQGARFTECDAALNSTQVLEDALGDAGPSTPLLFVLSPGADVVADVDKLAARLGYAKGVTYHNVSMGQGQDLVASERLEAGHKQGHWVLLNNIHLMPRWLAELEKRLDAFAAEGSHARFRVLLTSDASPAVPVGLLARAVKLTNEPPQGLKLNLKRAFCSFAPEYVNEADAKVRGILFALCHFHAVMIERKKFGPKGFNIQYPFSLGDLRDAAVCLTNYLEAAPTAGGKVPWDDLRYLFGQIIYGGHIVNDFDRLLCGTYLEHFLRDEVLDEMELFPYAADERGAGGGAVSFKAPAPTTYERYLEHIETELRGDTPVAYGLHPNAELGFRTSQTDALMRALLELQPRDDGCGISADRGVISGGSSSLAASTRATPRAIAVQVAAEITEAFAEVRLEPLIDEVAAMEDVGPYQNVVIIELKSLSALLASMMSSLATLKLGFAGKLCFSEDMEALEAALALDRVPAAWARLAWPSTRALAGWRHNLSARIAALSEWAATPAELPRVVWLGGLVNPQAFLTAVMQTAAQRTGAALDTLAIMTDVTKQRVVDVEASSSDCVIISGLWLQGARWDGAAHSLDKSRPREAAVELPVIKLRVVTRDRYEAEIRNGYYEAPVYKTEARGPTFIFKATLKTKSPPARWQLAGVAICLAPDGT